MNVNTKTTKNILFTDLLHLIESGQWNDTGVLSDIGNRNPQRILSTLSDEIIESWGFNRNSLISHLEQYARKVNQQRSDFSGIDEITVVSGYDKDGKTENGSFTIKRSEIVCIVGPTGSGKSRLLADIESLAQKDTPSGRQLLINNEVPTAARRNFLRNKLVAQLSQNMNFVMDLSVKKFLEMHITSRLIPPDEHLISGIIDTANELAGEKFSADTALTQLSGGQSRALMIADIAHMSSSPIVLIDEIENAGIDRKKALDLLVKKDKMVLISTHDPLLILMCPRRIVIKNGGINAVIRTTVSEAANLPILEKIDSLLIGIRQKLRNGEFVDMDFINKLVTIVTCDRLYGKYTRTTIYTGRTCTLQR